MTIMWRQLYEEERDSNTALKKSRTKYRKLLREIRVWMIEHGFDASLADKIKETLQEDK